MGSQPAATQRRLRTYLGSQKSGPSQRPQRTRRSVREEDLDESDGEDFEMDEGGDRDAADGSDDEIRGSGSANDEIQRRAADLARLALFTECKRIPLKRDDINKKVLASNSRSFPRVFEVAQGILRKTFGMELTELTSRSELETDGKNMGDELDEARKATGVKRKAVVGSKTYILRSVLHPLIIEHASQTDEQLFEAEMAENGEGSDDDDDDNFAPRSYGSIISWSECDNVGALGVLYTILALILVNGKTINDLELRTQLKRLGLSVDSHVPFPSYTIIPSVTIEQYLGTVIRQGYLERYQVGGLETVAGGKTKKSNNKRARVTLGEDAEGGGPTYEWKWGVRALSEVGELAIAKWIAEFMIATPTGEESEEDEEQRQTNCRTRGRKSGERNSSVKYNLEKMLKGVERAAGGTLDDIK